MTKSHPTLQSHIRFLLFYHLKVREMRLPNQPSPPLSATRAVLAAVIVATLAVTVSATTSTVTAADADVGVTTFASGVEIAPLYDEVINDAINENILGAALCEADVFHVLRRATATPLVADVLRLHRDGTSFVVGTIAIDPAVGVVSSAIPLITSTATNVMLLVGSTGYQFYAVPGSTESLTPIAAIGSATAWSTAVPNVLDPFFFSTQTCSAAARLFVIGANGELWRIDHNGGTTGTPTLTETLIAGSGSPATSIASLAAGASQNIGTDGLNGLSIQSTINVVGTDEVWFADGTNNRLYTLQISTLTITYRYNLNTVEPPATTAVAIGARATRYTHTSGITTPLTGLFSPPAAAGATYSLFSQVGTTQYTYRHILLKRGGGSDLNAGVVYFDTTSGALFFVDTRGAAAVTDALNVLRFATTDADNLVCPPGQSNDGTYLGFGHGTCTELSECSAEFDNCNENALCTNTVGSFTCACNDGWDGAGSNGVVCLDDNECTVGHDCVANAACTNTVGSFTCACNAGYDGTPSGAGTCADVDECTIPSHDCDSNAVCSDTTGSFTCACNDGWDGAGSTGVICNNDNECTATTDDCDNNAACTDTMGSFTCACNTGFQGSGTTCADEDECATGSHDCTVTPLSTCTNILAGGGFSCTCPAGYTGDGTQSGTGCSDVNECGATDDCDPVNAQCTNVPGSFACVCDAGWTGTATVSAPCTSINECTTGAHNCDANAACGETAGSFTCNCLPGFTGAGTTGTCVDDDECTLGTDNCDTNALCTNQAPGFACACNAGWMGSGTVCTNIDECTASTHNCNSNAACSDTSGSFTCACNTGFSGDGVTCTDDNECTLGTHDCHANALCTNAPAGNFTCTCAPGYIGDGKVSCTNADECTIGSHNCNVAATCTDSVGSFSCACDPGFSGNGVLCTDDDECTLGTHNCAASGGVCTNTAGSFTCACADGWAGTGVFCANLDECALGVGGIDDCHANAVCADTVGSFTCSCIAGYTDNPIPGTQPAGTDCVDINECAVANGGCVPVIDGGVCVNGPGTSSCACGSGWVGDGNPAGTGCFNLDECTLGADNCAVIATCADTPGSFTCTCPANFYTENNGVSCPDQNECIPGPLPGVGTEDCDLDASCTNVAGSFLCTCNTGYIGNGTSCVDRDECTLDIDNCDPTGAACTNSVGSFTCACSTGYADVPSNITAPGVACSDLDECALTTHNCFATATCANTAGSFSCTCPLGFSSVDGGVTCTDVDECTLSTDDCHSNAACTNTVGSFSCACNLGFIDNPVPGTQPDGTICLDLDECTLGTHTCGVNGMCTNNDGSFLCTCNAGYGGNGIVCTNLDECNLPPPNDDNCDANAACSDTTGSFLCTCNAGFVGIGTACVDVDECGITSDDCDDDAQCTNSIGSFSCACNTGYAGNGTSCVDIDECVGGTHTCNANAVCSNTIGGFMCACNPGFAGDGVVCFNLDECALGAHDCDPVIETCVETFGSFTCPCSTGYELSGGTCVDIDECTAGTDLCDADATCINNIGDHDCVCNAGFVGDGLTCVDIDECTLSAHNCDVNAACANTVGSFLCTCNPGYAFDVVTTVGNTTVLPGTVVPGDGTVCNDIDECATELDICDNNAACTNTVGSHTCACNTGWQGPGSTGLVCTDTDECLLGPPNHDCSVGLSGSSQCTNNVGSFTCACNPGYNDNPIPGTQPVGIDCVSTSECTLGTDNCDNNALCQEVVGSFTCTCNLGYSGDGITCSDLDECSDTILPPTGNSTFGNMSMPTIVPATNDCHFAASCTNTFGSFTCECQPPFAGPDNDGTNDDGTNCPPPNCANFSTICHPLAVCSDVPIFGVACACPAQFTGDGINVCAPGSETGVGAVVIDFNALLFNAAGVLQLQPGLSHIQFATNASVPLLDSLIIRPHPAGAPGVSSIFDLTGVDVDASFTSSGAMFHLDGQFSSITIRNAGIISGVHLFTVEPGTTIQQLVFEDLQTVFSGQQLLSAFKFVGRRLVLDLLSLVQGIPPPE